MNRTWAAHLPPQVTTSHHFTFSLRVLCPGKCSCVGGLDQIVILPQKLGPDARRLRYYGAVSAVRQVEERLLKKVEVVIGVFSEERLVGTAYIGQPDKGLTEVAFVTDPQFTGRGIARTLLQTIYTTIPKTQGGCTLKIVTLPENREMRHVMVGFASHHYLPMPHHDWDAGEIVLEIPVRPAA